MDSCPSDDALAAHAALGGADPAIAAHLAVCDACREAAAELADLAVESAAAAASPLALDETLLATPSDDAAPGSAATPASIVAGGFVGRYRVIRLVGAGAMGSVYLAYDPELDRRVALKLLRRELGEGAVGRELRERLVREAKAMARLAHPNVVTLYDVGQTDGQVFLSMEYVEGTTLRTWTQKERRPWSDVLAAFVDAGRGLAAAHAAGLVHRDFKPDNVLVSHDGRVRVTDFGLAAVSASSMSGAGAPRADDDALRTRTGALVGTPAYLAPELYDGGTADERADVFGFGVALFEGLYGARPYDGAHLGELIRNVRAGALAPPPVHAPKLPPALRASILRAIATDPAARTPTMEALLREITPKPRRGGLRLAAGALGVAVAAVAASVALASRRPPPLALPNGARPAVAVLGFEASRGADVGWVASELGETLRRELAVGGKLRVASRADVGAAPTADAAALTALRARTGVDYAIAGTFVPGRDQPTDDLELELHVYRADLGREVKTLRISGQRRGLIDVADEAAERLRAEIGVAPASAEDRVAAAKALPAKREAAEALARGTEQLASHHADAALALLERAVTIEPDAPLAHAALADALDDLGVVDRAVAESRRAFDLAGALSREERLSLEGRYRERAREWPKAAEIDQALFTFFPDSLEYGVRLATADTQGRRLPEATRTIAALRGLPKPLSDDLHIDLAEAALLDREAEFEEARAAAKAALAKAEAEGSDFLVAKALGRIATIDDDGADAPDAAADAARAKAAAERVRNIGGVEDCNNLLAHLAMKRRDYVEAARMLDANRALAEQTGDEVRLVQTYINLGVVLRQSSTTAAARAAYESAREHQGRSAFDPSSVSTIANNLATLYIEEANLDAAEENARRALELRRAAGDTSGSVTSLSNLAVVALERDELVEAERSSTEAVALARKIGSTRKIHATLLTAGAIAMY
ncbi:MAG TPA: serine/threonine-protein kinase, partial [Byssovorax sp.]